jgi:hypothetical protein
MVTREEFADLALALPEATPGSHFGQPDFRVHGKIFCGLERAGERASLKIRKDVQALLIASRPEAFVPAAGFWGESGWTYVELPRVARDELRELVLDAWRLIAPAKLVAQHSSNPNAAGDLVITVSPTVRAEGRRGNKKSKPKQTRGPETRTRAPSKKQARVAPGKKIQRKRSTPG